MSNKIHFSLRGGGKLAFDVREILRGYNGEDGVSPEVSVEEIDGGYRVIITDKDGEHSFDLLNGVDGKDGRDGIDGHTPVKGIDYVDGKDWIPTSDELNGIAESAAGKLQPTITELSQNVDTATLELAKKQDTIDDLESIRSGATKGETALQAIPVATASTIGGFKTSTWGGIGVYSDSGVGYIQSASDQQIRDRKKFTVYFAISPTNVDFAVKAALTDGKGLEYTEAEKAALRERAGIVGDFGGKKIVFNADGTVTWTNA